LATAAQVQVQIQTQVFNYPSRHNGYCIIVAAWRQKKEKKVLFHHPKSETCSLGPGEANLCWSGRLQRGWVFGEGVGGEELWHWRRTLKDYFSLLSLAAI